MTQSRIVKKIAKLLMKRFSIDNQEAVYLAYLIVSEVLKPETKITNMPGQHGVITDIKEPDGY